MYKSQVIIHQGQRRIAVYFDNKPALTERFRKLSGASWSASLKVWHLPYTEVYEKQFKPENQLTEKIDHLILSLIHISEPTRPY